MTYDIENLIKLYKEVAKVIGNKQNDAAINIMFENLRQYGKIISHHKLVAFCGYLNENFPYHGFVTEMLFAMGKGKETVILTDKEIGLLASLAKHHVSNVEMFRKL